MEADPRHVDLVLEHLRLTSASPVTTPLVKSTGDEDETLLDKEEASLYRSIAMRIGYLSSDRPDMLRTVRELAKRPQGTNSVPLGPAEKRRAVLERDASAGSAHPSSRVLCFRPRVE